MSMKLTRIVAMTGLVFGIGCGGGHSAVRPDQMSAEGHLQEAQKDRAASNSELQQSNSPALAPNLSSPPGSNPQAYDYPAEAYNPKTEHLFRAQELSKHAQQHEAAAAALESFEQAECKQFPPATRAACPLLGPVVELVDVPGGVRARFAEGTRVDAVVAHMRCHFAYAQAHGFGEMAGCPLYVRGIEIRRASDPRAVEIIGRDAAVTSEIRNRAREEAVLVREGRS
jgi:hypothetical protein